MKTKVSFFALLMILTLIVVSSAVAWEFADRLLPGQSSWAISPPAHQIIGNAYTSIIPRPDPSGIARYEAVVYAFPSAGADIRHVWTDPNRPMRWVDRDVRMDSDPVIFTYNYGWHNEVTEFHFIWPYR